MCAHSLDSREQGWHGSLGDHARPLRQGRPGRLHELRLRDPLLLRGGVQALEGAKAAGRSKPCWRSAGGGSTRSSGWCCRAGSWLASKAVIIIITIIRIIMNIIINIVITIIHIMISYFI